ALCQIHPNVTVSTVYNVLDCFARHGLINRLSTPQGKLFYDVNTTTHHHIVTSCGTLIDYDAPQLTAMINDFFDKNPISGHTINSVSLQLYEKPFF
ncbi:MAG: transcriptional repressor, partial [Mucinivorans sp.]